MGATSVTGTGNGSAENIGLKGPGNNRDQWVPMVAPRIVAAGNLNTSDPGKIASIVFPEALPGAPTAYNVLLTVVDSGGVNDNEVVVTAKAGTTTFTGFSVASHDADQNVGWVVMSNGAA